MINFDGIMKIAKENPMTPAEFVKFVKDNTYEALIQNISGQNKEQDVDAVTPGLGVEKEPPKAEEVKEEQKPKEKEPLTVIDAHMNVYHGLKSLLSGAWNWVTGLFK